MENVFLKRINQIVGEHQMNKIRGMINDIINSKKVNAEFDQFLVSKKPKSVVKEAKVELDIYLLTKAKWPSEILNLGVCAPPPNL